MRVNGRKLRYTGPQVTPSQAAGLAITRPFGAKVIPCISCGVLAWATLFYLVYGPHTGLSCNTLRLWAGNCCLRHPFSLVLEPRQGGDICSLAGLTWPHVVIPAKMSSLQYRHGAPPRHGAMCRGPPSGGFYPVGGFLSKPCQYIPCPLLPNTRSCVFIARHNINRTNIMSLSILNYSSQCTSNLNIP